jgi:hypothetical protein
MVLKEKKALALSGRVYRLWRGHGTRDTKRQRDKVARRRESWKAERVRIGRDSDWRDSRGRGGR